MSALLVHLRLPFQLLLAPVFLWGWLVAGGGWRPQVGLAFVACHVFLYGGATAFNSYYDRDEGPVGGLERPPPVSPALLPFSLGVKAVGWLLAALVNLPFWLLYGIFAALSLAYSHPRPRLKAHPVGSLITVGFGQGVLAYLAAWAAVRGELGSVLGPTGLLGALAAMLLILALYPLTQLYQVDEDARRGDRTIAVVWGPARCFAFAVVCSVLGGLAMLGVLAQRFGRLDALLVGLGLLGQVAAVGWWARGYEPSRVLTNYRHVMRLNTLSAGALAAYLVARLLYA